MTADEIVAASTRNFQGSFCDADTIAEAFERVRTPPANLVQVINCSFSPENELVRGKFPETLTLLLNLFRLLVYTLVPVVFLNRDFLQGFG